jgi:hypothetical protein
MIVNTISVGNNSAAIKKERLERSFSLIGGGETHSELLLVWKT